MDGGVTAGRDVVGTGKDSMHVVPADWDVWTYMYAWRSRVLVMAGSLKGVEDDAVRSLFAMG